MIIEAMALSLIASVNQALVWERADEPRGSCHPSGGPKAAPS